MSGIVDKQQIESIILQHLNTFEEIQDSWTFSIEKNIEHTLLIGVIKSLLVDAYVSTEELSCALWLMNDEALDILANGSHEVRLFNEIPAEVGISVTDLESKVGKDVFKIGRGQCMKNKWIQLGKDGIVKRSVDSVEDETRTSLVKIHRSEGAIDSISEDLAKTLKRRKLIAVQTRKSCRVLKGVNFSLDRKKQAADLTKEMLEKGSWKTETFKPYNFNTLGTNVGGGHLHPLMKVRSELRRVLMDMGFDEMPTNKYVESSFWNFDALFQPQAHPARDAHDTFFLKNPQFCNSVPEEYYQRVEDIHENGGFGSIGHGKGTFTRDEATRNILRTHTTAVSARMLYKLANQPGGFKPAKYFSIDRVFRNESMDATHLAEFHQVEGLLADYDLSLGDLIGVMRNFFTKIGITELRFKPAFNPYTEPSMEIFGFHPDLNTWTEIGNSGVFRPEMLRPMGLPENVRCIAWGLSLERPTMIKYRINNIRDLFGHKVDLEQTRTAKLYRW